MQSLWNLCSLLPSVTLMQGQTCVAFVLLQPRSCQMQVCAMQEGSGPIIKAIRYGHADTVKLLLRDKRVDVTLPLKVRTVIGVLSIPSIAFEASAAFP